MVEKYDDVVAPTTHDEDVHDGQTTGTSVDPIAPIPSHAPKKRKLGNSKTAAIDPANVLHYASSSFVPITVPNHVTKKKKLGNAKMTAIEPANVLHDVSIFFDHITPVSKHALKKRKLGNTKATAAVVNPANVLHEATEVDTSAINDVNGSVVDDVKEEKVTREIPSCRQRKANTP